MRRTLLAAIVTVGFVASNLAFADEMKLVGDDATSIPIPVSNCVFVELSTDIQDVVIADPAIVNVVVRSKRRVMVVGTTLGRTKVSFFDDKGQQIGELNLNIVSGLPKPSAERDAFAAPANLMEVPRARSAAATRAIGRGFGTAVGAMKRHRA